MNITSTKNPIIKEIKSLSRKKARYESRLFVMEGIKIISEAIMNKIVLKYILFTDKLLTTDEGIDFFNIVKDMENTIKVTDNVFKEISDTENPQGVLAVGYFELNNIQDALNKKSLIFLDNLQDPGNLGTIIRSCDAFNLDGIILGDGCVDPYNSKVIRATMGSIFRVPLYIVKNSIETLKTMISNQFYIYATSLEASIPNYKVDYNGNNFIIVIGNESKGIDYKIIELTDQLIKIPMPGNAESLNAGVAASIIMYEAMKQISE